MDKKAAFRNLGCKVNSYESEYVQQRFKENGFQIVSFDQKADVYVVNTCTVTNIADRKSRQMLHRAKALNPDAIVVAMGCYVETGKAQALEDDCIDVLIGNNDKGHAYEIIAEAFNNKLGNASVVGEDGDLPGRKEIQNNQNFISIGNVNEENRNNNKENSLEISDKKRITNTDISKVKEYDEFKLTFNTEHTRVHVKIQDGCNQFCSYCAIPLARGRIRSREIENIVDEITGLAEKGYKEFVLTGIHLSSYGMENYNVQINQDAENTERVLHPESKINSDIPSTIDSSSNIDNEVHTAEEENVISNSSVDGTGNIETFETFENNTRLIDAIEAVAGIEGVKRIRLGSLEPRIITDEFLRRLAATGKICPHFHLSLQSGSDSVLKRMNRKYSAEEFYEKAMLIRKYFEHPGITTDVIAGFPGETEEEFAETKDFVNKVDFYEAHIFKYSRRKGTVADRLPGQLTDKEKSARSDILIKDADKRSVEFRKYYIDKPVEVLFEEIVDYKGEKYLTGYTREYVKVFCKFEDLEPLDTPDPQNMSNSVGISSGYINNIYEGKITGFITDEIMSFSVFS